MRVTTVLGHLWLLMRARDHGKQSICSSTVWKGLYYDDRHLVTVLTRRKLERDEDQIRREFTGFLEALSAAGFLEKQEGRFNVVCPGCLQEQEIELRGDVVTCAVCGERSPLGQWSAEQVYILVPQLDYVRQTSASDKGAEV